MLPGVSDGRLVAEKVLAGLRSLAPLDAGIQTVAQIGIGRFDRGMSVGAVLARTDRALAAAESSGGNNWQTARDEDSPFQPVNTAEWVRQIRDVISARRIRLAAYPVRSTDGRLLHDELMLRVQIDPAGDWLAAGQIMPMASRVGLTGELDLAAVDLALERVRAGDSAVAVNLAAESAESDAFRRELLRRLQIGDPGGTIGIGGLGTWSAPPFRSGTQPARGHGGQRMRFRRRACRPPLRRDHPPSGTWARLHQG